MLPINFLAALRIKELGAGLQKGKGKRRVQTPVHEGQIVRATTRGEVLVNEPPDTFPLEEFWGVAVGQSGEACSVLVTQQTSVGVVAVRHGLSVPPVFWLEYFVQVCGIRQKDVRAIGGQLELDHVAIFIVVITERLYRSPQGELKSNK